MADTAKHFIVVWDDDMGLCCPMGWDSDCEGALCANAGRVALFRSRAAARKAIRISAAYAKLCNEQGKRANDDFLEGIGHVKVLECKEQSNG